MNESLPTRRRNSKKKQKEEEVTLSMIMENAAKIKEAIAEGVDMSDGSELGSSDCSLRAEYDETPYDLFESLMASTAKLLAETPLMNQSYNVCTIGTKDPEQRMGSNNHLRVISCGDDVHLLTGKYSQVEIWLLGNPLYALEEVFLASVQKVYDHTLGEPGSVEGPNINQCLAWIAHASQTFLSSLVPGGELGELQAERYRQARLVLPQLKSFNEVRETTPGFTVLQREALRLAWAVRQTTRIFKLLSLASLHTLNDEDKILLFFAIARLYIDASADDQMKQQAALVFQNILSSVTDMDLFLRKLAPTFVLITGSPTMMLDVFMALRFAKYPPLLICSLICHFLIRLCERVECTPHEKIEDAEHFARTHIQVIIDVYHDVVDRFNKPGKKYHVSSIISIVNMALSPSVLKCITPELYEALKQTIETQTLEAAQCKPDEAILKQQWLSQLRRLLRVYETRGGVPQPLE